MTKLKSDILGIFLMKPFAYIVSLVGTWLIHSAELLLVMTIFVLIDLLTGVWKVVKSKGWSHITSMGFRRTIEKFVGYSMIIVLGLILDKSILNIDWFSLIKLFTGLIVLAEFKSITENLTEITGNKIFARIFEIASDLFKKKTNHNETN